MPINTTSFGLANTSSFRRASKQLLGMYGSNLQNPSPAMMKIYKPRDGNIFIQPDQAGAEALVVSMLCPDGKYRQLFKHGVKCHTYTAAHVYEKFWAELGYNAKRLLSLDIPTIAKDEEWGRLAKVIKKDYEHPQYFVGKKAGHSLNYRMKPPTFREDVLKESEAKVALTLLESQAIYDIYHNRIAPEISQAWWPEIEFQVRKTGYLFNLFGFPRYCQGPYTDKTWRELTAFVPQSTVGCITAIAFCTMQRFIEENNLSDEWHLRNDKHDSILLECPEHHKEEAVAITKASIEQELKSPRGETFWMKSEVSWGYNWAKQTKENPDGMREAA